MLKRKNPERSERALAQGRDPDRGTFLKRMHPISPANGVNDLSAVLAITAAGVQQYDKPSSPLGLPEHLVFYKESKTSHLAFEVNASHAMAVDARLAHLEGGEVTPRRDSPILQAETMTIPAGASTLRMRIEEVSRAHREISRSGVFVIELRPAGTHAWTRSPSIRVFSKK